MANVWCEPALPWGRGVKKGRVCWRDGWTVGAEGGATRPKRSVTVTGAAARDGLLARVRRALDVEGHYVHAPPAEQKLASLELAAAAWIRHKASRGAATGTIRALTSGWTRIARDTRALLGLADTHAIRCAELSRGLVTRLLERWRTEGLSEQRRYDLTLYLYGAWVWASDDSLTWPGVPVAPRDASAVLPPAPARGRAPDAPSLGEVDVICRRARVRSAHLGDVVACLRLTGLRVGQVVAIRVGEVDLRRRTLTVGVGKSRQEKADQREVPLHPSLLRLLEPRMLGRAPSAFVFAPDAAGLRACPYPGEAVRELWQSATADGEVWEHVWKPRNRGKARPDHAFRAAFLAALAADGVPEDVRRALVGHAPGTTEGRSYSTPTLEVLRTHLDRLPAIVWSAAPPPAT